MSIIYRPTLLVVYRLFSRSCWLRAASMYGMMIQPAPIKHGLSVLFEQVKIRALIRRSLSQVPPYLWNVKPTQLREITDLVCSATKELWGWEPFKKETVTRK